MEWFLMCVIGLTITYLEHLQEQKLRAKGIEGKHTGYGF
jgi:hypothetical protein